jgi:hypothetical protein
MQAILFGSKLYLLSGLSITKTTSLYSGDSCFASLTAEGERHPNEEVAKQAVPEKPVQTGMKRPRHDDTDVLTRPGKSDDEHAQRNDAHEWYIS